MVASSRMRLKTCCIMSIIGICVLVAMLALAGCDDDEIPSSSSSQESAAPSATGLDEGSARAPRYINIVYDDSTSMNEDTAWCQARYALEVFAAMLDENDTMKVFTMGSADKGKTDPDVVISGKESIEARTAKVHADFSEIDSWTNFGAAQSAYNDLKSIKNQPPGTEKWLIILTDGGFTVYENDTVSYYHAGEKDASAIAALVQNDLNRWAAEGIHVEYIGMREDAVLFDSGENLSSQVVSPANILSKIIEESNKIFERAVLPADCFDGSQLEIAIPMKKIVVFAQGEGVSIGSLDARGTMRNTESTQVHYAEKPNKTYVNPADNPSPVDKNLQGQVSIFEGEFEQGTAKLTVNNAQQTDIYYEPFVDVRMTMNASDGSQVVLNQGTKAELKPGEYTATFELHDPFTGELVSSNLIKSTDYETVLRYADGTEITIPEGGAIQIDEGEAQIVGRAVINGEVPYTQNYQVDIISRNMGVEVLSKPAEPVDAHTLDSSDPIVVRVNNQGTALSADEMAATKLDVTTPLASEPKGLLGWLFGSRRGLDYQVEPTAEPGVFNIHLKTNDGHPTDTVDGDVPLHISATRDAGFGGYSSFGETDTTLQIAGVSLIERILHWLLTHLLQLILLLLLALLIAFVVMQVRKPRIPKNLSPNIVGVENEDSLNLSYSRKSIKHAIWPPWSPETAQFKMTVQGDATNAYQLPQRFQLGGRSIGIVATKTKRGKRAVRLSDNAVEAMKKQMDDYDNGKSIGSFPNPEYTSIESVFIHGGGGFTLQGKKPHKRKGWEKSEETTYYVQF